MEKQKNQLLFATLGIITTGVFLLVSGLNPFLKTEFIWDTFKVGLGYGLILIGISYLFKSEKK